MACVTTRHYYIENTIDLSTGQVMHGDCKVKFMLKILRLGFLKIRKNNLDSWKSSMR
jgi:hypothetical protein